MDGLMVEWARTRGWLISWLHSRCDSEVLDCGARSERSQLHFGHREPMHLHIIHERLPQLASNTVERFDGEHDDGGCLTELRSAADGLDRQGFVGRPSWVDLQAGIRPPPSTFTKPGEWAHGWQFFCFRAPLSEDRGSCPAMSQRPGTPEVPTQAADALT